MATKMEIYKCNVCVNADKITAREYCNLHGLWKA